MSDPKESEESEKSTEVANAEAAYDETAHNKTVYNKAVEKGKLILAAMNAHIGTENPLASPSPWFFYKQLSLHSWRKEALNASYWINVEAHKGEALRRLMEELNIDKTPSENIGVKWMRNVNYPNVNLPLSSSPKNAVSRNGTDEEEAQFPGIDAYSFQFFNISSGTVFVIDVASPSQKRKNDCNDDVPIIGSGRETLQHWSDVTFLEWQELATEEAVRSLRRVVHVEVVNDTTKMIMEDILAKRGIIYDFYTRVKEEFRVEDGKDFLALLGTPNGSGFGFLLAQRKLELGCKVVRKITVILQEGIWILMLDAED